MQRKHAVCARKPLWRHPLFYRSVKVVKRFVVCRHVKGIGGHHQRTVACAVSNGARGMRHADEDARSAIDALKHKAGVKPEMLRYRRRIVRRKSKAGNGQTVDGFPWQSR